MHIMVHTGTMQCQNRLYTSRKSGEVGGFRYEIIMHMATIVASFRKFLVSNVFAISVLCTKALRKYLSHLLGVQFGAPFTEEV